MFMWEGKALTQHTLTLKTKVREGMLLALAEAVGSAACTLHTLVVDGSTVETPLLVFVAEVRQEHVGQLEKDAETFRSNGRLVRYFEHGFEPNPCRNEQVAS